MFLTHLSLEEFRNFARLDIDIPSGVVLLWGANAQGKTSLLEAIYFLATFTSFHADHDRQLINFLALRKQPAVARIVAIFNRDGISHRLETRIIQDTNGVDGGLRVRKEVLLDGLRVKMGEAMGIFNAVLFLPQMVRVIEGGPDERRRFLNLALTQVQPRYGEILADYLQALTQRNALLKKLSEYGGDTGQLSFWDELLASKGSQLILARIQIVQELERLAGRVHRELTHGGEVLRLSYQPAYDPLPKPASQYALPLEAPIDRTGIALEEIQQGFQDSLKARRIEDISRGVTTLGPHRDELRFFESGIDLGTYGSRGQVRTAMLAIKLAEVAWMEKKTGHAPVLLFDEALAELDPDRRADLLASLASVEQILLTTTDLALFSPQFINMATVWKVKEGRLERSEI